MLKTMKPKCDKMVMKHEKWIPTLRPQLHFSWWGTQLLNVTLTMWLVTSFITWFITCLIYKSAPGRLRLCATASSTYLIHWLYICIHIHHTHRCTHCGSFQYKCMYARAVNNGIWCMHCGRKYLNWCTPFWPYSQWIGLLKSMVF